MKKILIVILLFVFSLQNYAQEKTVNFDKNKFLKEISENSCKCIDSIDIAVLKKDSVISKINSCIDNQVGAYQIGSKLANIKDLDNSENKDITISISFEKDSKEYKQSYYEIEQYLMENCKELKEKIASNNKSSERSYSDNHESIKFYNLGIDESKKENYEKAIEYFKKAVVFDSNFAFAYDNIGICSRKLNRFDDAIDAYEKSLKIDPNGVMPLQNIGVAYIYKKEYKKAVRCYEKLATLDKNNPEVYYGIGNIYTQYLFDYEKALDNLCQAYNLYVEQKSPYRADAEKLIQIVYSEMKKQGKEDKFKEILKEHHISPN